MVLPTNWPPGAEQLAEYTINTRAMENSIYGTPTVADNVLFIGSNTALTAVEAGASSAGTD